MKQQFLPILQQKVCKSTITHSTSHTRKSAGCFKLISTSTLQIIMCKRAHTCLHLHFFRNSQFEIIVSRNSVFISQKRFPHSYFKFHATWAVLRLLIQRKMKSQQLFRNQLIHICLIELSSSTSLLNLRQDAVFNKKNWKLKLYMRIHFRKCE